MLKVYLIYKALWDGVDLWETVEDIYINHDKAEWDRLKLEEEFGDDYISYYIEERIVDQSTL